MVKARENTHRTPPFSVEFEQALLAGCIIDGGTESITLCIQEKIAVESFYLPAHSLIYGALLELYNAGSPLNELIVAEKLAARGELEKVGGHDYIDTITSRIDTPTQLKYYIDRIRDLDLVRKIIDVATRSIEDAYAGVDDIKEFIDGVERSIFSIAENRISDSIKHANLPIEKAVALISRTITNRGETNGILSGFIDLDKLTYGFHPGEMIVIAARPSMGKTSFALNIAENTTASKKQPIPTLFFSLEMSAEQLALRMLCSRTGVDMVKLRNGFYEGLDHKKLSSIATELKKIPLWIDESGSLSINEMRAKARRMCHQHRIGLIIVDYLQLLASREFKISREQQIAEISRGIKTMAKELNLPVIVLSQLNRASDAEKRQPRLSDLRDSGSIEQDADLVLILSKPKEGDEEQEVAQDVVPRDLIIAKQRNGPTGVVRLAFRKSLTRFENYAQEKNI
ncbi:MAG: replicative DNA helicase [Puniceicoccales bacterium]|nr:replicative DNA helicase [Puniceicoccales bacterium]